MSIKCEAAGVESAYLGRQVGLGDVLKVSAPRGRFTLEPGTFRSCWRALEPPADGNLLICCLATPSCEVVIDL